MADVLPRVEMTHLAVSPSVARLVLDLDQAVADGSTSGRVPPSPHKPPGWPGRAWLRRIWPSMPVRLIPPGVPAALGLSLAGLLLGLCWKAARVNTEDLRWALTIHSMRLPTWLDRWVTLLRPLGRSWLSWGLVLLTALASPQFALFLGIALAICTVAERGVKVLVNRPRPFVLLPELRPPPGLVPSDPSYPSGDAARAWLLAVFLATLPGVPPWATFHPAGGSLRRGVRTGAARSAFAIGCPGRVLPGSRPGLGSGAVAGAASLRLPAVGAGYNGPHGDDRSGEAR